eukprot:gb/GEZJ01005134.1/.p1 GENE.gb/GEZJ01005134.1/~~gb/GEZJ01005134.1/.p1  ORF type:complete len:129 (+),score=16.97 gb/GEZJ01005134.1/:326-712(+)
MSKSEKQMKLRLLQLNCRGLLNAAKRAELSKNANDCQIDLICLRETFLKKSDRSPTIEGYEMLGRYDRQDGVTLVGGRGGAAAGRRSFRQSKPSSKNGDSRSFGKNHKRADDDIKRLSLFQIAILNLV